MLNKDAIITLAWMKLGEQSQYYNGNITERQKVAEYLFDTVVRNIASDSNFLFNSRKTSLEKNSNPETDDGEFRYNIPVDFLNKIWISDPTARFEHEFIYSSSEELKMAYCYRLQFSEYPEYLEDYITASVAYKLAEAYETFAPRAASMINEVEEERARILKMEGLPFGIVGR